MTTQYVTVPTSTTPGGQPVQVVYFSNPGQPRSRYTIEYKRHDLTAVKWVSCIQMALAILCVIAQAITLGITDFWLSVEGSFRSKFHSSGTLDIYMGYIETPDIAGTGIWVGLVMIVTAAVGIASWNKNQKGLIIAYMVLSIFLIPFTVSLIGTSAAAVEYVRECRHYGLSFSVYQYSYYDSYYDYSYYNYRSTTPRTTTHSTPIYLLGERLGSYSNAHDFHCTHPLFKAWMAIDAILILAATMMFILSLVSVVYSSKAACGGCCSCCSCCQGEQDPGTVVYHAQPQNQPITPMMQQPVMYAAPINTTQPRAMYVTQPPAPIVYPMYQQQQQQTTQFTAAATPGGAEAAAPEEKERPPPDYTANTE